MTIQVWREDEIEDRSFNAPMLTASSTTSSIIEGETYLYSQEQRNADIIYTALAGRLVAIEHKVSPTREHEYFARPSPLGSSYESKLISLIVGSRHVYKLFNQSAVEMSRSLIDELSRNVELWGSVSSSYTNLLKEEDHPQLEAVHPLTSSAYDQLTEIPTPTKEAIQSILNQFTTFVLYTVTAGLPPLRLVLLEDSSYLLEWIFEDRRLGFSFETDPKDSGWYFVFSAASSERYESGTMDQLEMGRLVNMMLKR